jgi:hypothetical protein
MLVKVMGYEHHGEHRDLGVKLHLHEALNHGVGDEIVSIYAALGRLGKISPPLLG